MRCWMRLRLMRCVERMTREASRARWLIFWARKASTFLATTAASGTLVDLALCVLSPQPFQHMAH